MTDELLATLKRHANSRSLVLVSETVLLSELRIDGAALRSQLAKAEVAGFLEVLSPLPFLVARLLGSWSGERPDAAKEPRESGVTGDHAYSFQSSLSQSKPWMKESYRQQVSEEELLQEILKTLGETDPSTFRGAIRSYPAGVIQLTLERVRKMRTVRKNRTALFRYLLPRVFKESSSNK